MTALKKLWFFLVFSLGLATLLIFLFPYERVYLLVLLLGMVGVGTAYVYVTGATFSLVSSDFSFLSALGVSGLLVGGVYELFLFMNAPSSLAFLYPLHFLLSLWMTFWLFLGVWYSHRRVSLRWPFWVIYGVLVSGLWFLLRSYTAFLLPLWQKVFLPYAHFWILGMEGVLLVSLAVLIVHRHKVLSTLYTALVLWFMFRILTGFFWWRMVGHEDSALWLQYILTLEWIGFLFGLDGVIYTGIHYPFHKLHRQLQMVSEEKMLSLRLDRVTRALNAEAFQDMVRYEVLRQKRQKSDLGLLVIEAVIEIASTNYTCPDNILGLLAASFRANLRAHDVISHWGGGRFVILFMDTDLVGVCAVGKKMSEVVAMSEYLCGEKSAKVTLFMGASVYVSGMSVEDFLSVGFVNLQRAKERKSPEVVTEAIFDYPEKV
ncbi:MAG: diguanylate cyclase [Brevinematales bacterium]|nr:diguanylate cyclase [Brevinematales bacterium]